MPQLAIIITVIRTIDFKKFCLAAITIDAKNKAMHIVINIRLFSKKTLLIENLITLITLIEESVDKIVKLCDTKINAISQLFVSPPITPLKFAFFKIALLKFAPLISALLKFALVKF
ncbi:MAG: hypothetical protein AAFV71_09975 [Cyanobacteria bacterium J06633_8]